MDSQNTILDSSALHSEHENATYELATFGDRLVAALIDGFIVAIPSYFLPIIFGWLYFALQQQGKNQATVGQTMMNIKLVSLDGNQVSFGQATGRFFARFLSALFLFGGFFMFFFNDKKQCLHDYMAGTIVVKTYRK